MKMSLKFKAILLIILVSILIGVTGIIVYKRGINTLITQEYAERSVDITRAMASIVDTEQVRTLRDAVLEIYREVDEVVLSDMWGTPEFEQYVAQFRHIEEREDFLSLREQLRRVQDVIHVDCLYISWLDASARRTVYLVDAAYEGDCPPGCADPLFSEDIPVLDDPTLGFAPDITETEEYGYLMATGMPIQSADGEVLAYAIADLSMNEIVSHENELLRITMLVFGIVTVLASVLGILAVEHWIVRPINKLSDTAKTYTANELRFAKLNIRTGDEIETLANSIKRMEQDIRDYYDHLIEVRSDLETAREHANELSREANIDALTKLRNKRAYDLAIGRLEQSGEPFGIAMIDLNNLKLINDNYGHDKGDVALRGLADLICRVFKHSPVFRVGGDEFVVILKNEDLEAREGLIGQFRDRLRRSSKNSALPYWERLSAACGVAVSESHPPEPPAAVFKRADEDMYRNKKQMKGEAGTRQ